MVQYSKAVNVIITWKINKIHLHRWTAKLFKWTDTFTKTPLTKVKYTVKAQIYLSLIHMIQLEHSHCRRNMSFLIHSLSGSILHSVWLKIFLHMLHIDGQLSTMASHLLIQQDGTAKKDWNQMKLEKCIQWVLPTCQETL